MASAIVNQLLIYKHHTRPEHALTPAPMAHKQASIRRGHFPLIMYHVGVTQWILIIGKRNTVLKNGAIGMSYLISRGWKHGLKAAMIGGAMMAQRVPRMECGRIHCIMRLSMQVELSCVSPLLLDRDVIIIVVAFVRLARLSSLHTHVQSACRAWFVRLFACTSLSLPFLSLTLELTAFHCGNTKYKLLASRETVPIT